MNITKFLVAAVFTLSLTPVAFAGAKKPAVTKPLPPVKTIQKLDINPERVVVLRGPVTKQSVDPVINRMAKLDETPGDIFFIINSPGGSVFDGLQVVRTMTSIKTKVVCIVDNAAFSMGAIILSYCKEAYVHKYGSVMFHRARYGVQGYPEEVLSRVDILQKMLDLLNIEVAKNLKMTKEQYLAKIVNEWWMTAEEAVRAGLAQAVLEELVYTFEEEASFGIFFSEDDDEKDKSDKNTKPAIPIQPEPEPYFDFIQGE